MNKSLTVYAAAPETIEVDAASLFIIAKGVFADYYNSSEEFRRQTTTLPGSYIVSGPVDEWRGAEMFANYCRDIAQGPAAQIAHLDPDKLLGLFRKLRKKSNTSPAARRALAKKQANPAPAAAAE